MALVNRDIRIRLDNGNWVPARDYQITAFIRYNDMITSGNNRRVYHYNENGYIFSIERLPDTIYGGIYLIRENNTRSPIVDYNNIKVFLINHNNRTDWYHARNYQKYAYLDFIYSSDVTRYYKSKNTIGHPNHIEIPIDGLEPNIIFSMSRNENGSIYYEKNDAGRTRVRICDNTFAQNGYRAFYNRMTDNFMSIPIISNTSISATGYLPVPLDVVIETTSNDEKICVICNSQLQNIRFLPCNHVHTCSLCYLQLTKPRECPICKQTINQIVKYTP
jgi:hypothetical protein